MQLILNALAAEFVRGDPSKSESSALPDVSDFPEFSQLLIDDKPGEVDLEGLDAPVLAEVRFAPGKSQRMPSISLTAPLILAGSGSKQLIETVEFPTLAKRDVTSILSPEEYVPVEPISDEEAPKLKEIGVQPNVDASAEKLSQKDPISEIAGPIVERHSPPIGSLVDTVDVLQGPKALVSSSGELTATPDVRNKERASRQVTDTLGKQEKTILPEVPEAPVRESKQPFGLLEKAASSPPKQENHAGQVIEQSKVEVAQSRDVIADMQRLGVGANATPVQAPQTTQVSSNWQSGLERRNQHSQMLTPPDHGSSAEPRKDNSTFVVAPAKAAAVQPTAMNFVYPMTGLFEFDPKGLATDTKAEPMLIGDKELGSLVRGSENVRPDPIARNVVSQVVVAVQKVQADGFVEVRLHPEELGRVRMTMTQNEAGMTVHITADKPETLELFRRNIDQFEMDMEREGFSDLSFAFSSDQQNEGDSDQPDLDSKELITKSETNMRVDAAEILKNVSDGRVDIRM